MKVSREKLKEIPLYGMCYFSSLWIEEEKAKCMHNKWILKGNKHTKCSWRWKIEENGFCQNKHVNHSPGQLLQLPGWNDGESWWHPDFACTANVFSASSPARRVVQWNLSCPFRLCPRDSLHFPWCSSFLLSLSCRHPLEPAGSNLAQFICLEKTKEKNNWIISQQDVIY